MELNKIYQGSALDVLKTFPDEVIDCCVTSPPYFGLRAYSTNPQIWGGDPDCEHIWETEETSRANQSGGKGHMQDGNKGSFVVDYNNRISKSDTCHKCGAWLGELGGEPTFDLFIDHLISIFAEVKRVLKKTGTCWVNLGDSYASSGGASRHFGYTDPKYPNGRNGIFEEPSAYPQSVLPKSLCGIPERFALAMTDKLGFIRRNTLIWKKNNVMPSSASDRYTIDFEYIYFFSKSQKYHFEQQFEPVKQVSIDRLYRAVSNKNKWVNGADGQTKQTISQPRPNRTTKIPAELAESMGSPRARYKRIEKSNAPHEFDGPDHLVSPFDPERGRNARATWEINTQPFSGAHFAVFPPELPRRCITAGCPKDICRKCGFIREKVIEEIKGDWIPTLASSPDAKKGGARTRLILERKDNGYTDCGCDHSAGWSKGVVLDPFMGAGTTALVAKQLGRDYIGIELNPDYIKIAESRIDNEPASLF